MTVFAKRGTMAQFQLNPTFPIPLTCFDYMTNIAHIAGGSLILYQCIVSMFSMQYEKISEMKNRKMANFLAVSKHIISKFKCY